MTDKHLFLGIFAIAFLCAAMFVYGSVQSAKKEREDVQEKFAREKCKLSEIIEIPIIGGQQYKYTCEGNMSYTINYRI